MIHLQPHAEGTILPVRAQPGARRNQLRGVQDGMLKVGVTQAPEKGKANKALLAVLADTLGLRRGQMELLAGHTSAQKRILVRGLPPEVVEERIRRALGHHDT